MCGSYSISRLGQLGKPCPGEAVTDHFRRSRKFLLEGKHPVHGFPLGLPKPDYLAFAGSAGTLSVDVGEGSGTEYESDYGTGPGDVCDVHTAVVSGVEQDVDGQVAAVLGPEMLSSYMQLKCEHHSAMQGDGDLDQAVGTNNPGVASCIAVAQCLQDSEGESSD